MGDEIDFKGARKWAEDRLGNKCKCERCNLIRAHLHVLALLEKIGETINSTHQERKCAKIGAGTMMNASFAEPMVAAFFDDLDKRAAEIRQVLGGKHGE